MLGGGRSSSKAGENQQISGWVTRKLTVMTLVIVPLFFLAFVFLFLVLFG